MSNNKGGRPPHHDGEIKKAAIAVRTAPSIRDALKVAADEAGRSVTQEVEARLSASLEADGGERSPETSQLLNKIAAGIADAETMTGKRWHRDRKTAGAVLEMLRLRIHEWIRTDDPYEDEIVAAAWDRLHEARQLRDKLEELLADFGVQPITPEPKKLKASKTTALGLGAVFDDILDNAFAQLKGRWRERKEAETLSLPDPMANAVRALIEQLEAADERVEEADQVYAEAIRPYSEAELSGRELYREAQLKRAREAADRGDLTTLLHMTRGASWL